MNNCKLCQKTSNLTQIKVATTDPQFNLIKGQIYHFCSSCSPKIREYNDYDLLNENPHLWEKYPFADAKEILEKEFGIKEN